MSNSTPPSDSCEIVSQRVIPFPREVVWQAWMVPWQLARWWGPKGFTNTFSEFNPTPGGDWHFIMHGPDGRDYPNHQHFLEVVKHERLVLEHRNQPHFRLTVTLSTVSGGTLLDFRQRFADAETCAKIATYAVPANEENFDRLIALLATSTAVMGDSTAETPGDCDIVITRVIKAPVALVYAAWTEPKHIGAWWGPVGFTTTTESMDLRPGGLWRYTMHGPDGIDYLNVIRYEVVEENRRLEYQHAGEGDHDHIRFRTVVTFIEHDGHTMVTMRSVFESAAGRTQVIEQYGAIEGGKQTLARLADFVEHG